MTLRTRQVQLLSRWIVARGQGRRSKKIVSALGRVPGAVPFLVGYKRQFASLPEARRSIGEPAGSGHSTQAAIDTHLALSTVARPSDFAAFYYLSRYAASVHRVFDLGGNVGNLYYYYKNYLNFAPDLEWRVWDLPQVVAAGRRIAAERQATGLQFTNEFADASGVDLLIASGSMHYMDTPIASMIASLPIKPRFVLINRTPLTDGPAFATIQDASTYRVACMVCNKGALIGAFKAAGYRLVGDWEVAELALQLPFHTSHPVLSYSGVMFELMSES